MIAITKNSLNLVVPFQSLEDVLMLQLGLLEALRSQVDAGTETTTSTVVGPLTDLLQATLFSEDQMQEIEALFRSKAAPPAERAPGRSPARAAA